MTHPKANIGLLSLSKSTAINNRLFNEESKQILLNMGLVVKKAEIA